MLGRQYAAKRRPHQLAWTGALIMYGIASFAEMLSQLNGWSELLFKTYYVFGAVMVVGYLALGTLYIQDPKVSRWLILISGIFALPAVFFSSLAATIDSTEKFAVAGLFVFILVELMILAWVAKEKFAGIWFGHVAVAAIGGIYVAAVTKADIGKLVKLIAANDTIAKAFEPSLASVVLRSTAVTINTVGGLVLILGAVYSGYALLRKNILREVAIGTTLIGVGATFPFFAGYLVQYFEVFGQEIKSIFLTIGIVIMFFGFLRTSRPDPAPAPEKRTETPVETPA